jgi:hypothetical protein
MFGVPQPPKFAVPYGLVVSTKVTLLHLPVKETDILGTSAIQINYLIKFKENIVAHHKDSKIFVMGLLWAENYALKSAGVNPKACTKG